MTCVWPASCGLVLKTSLASRPDALPDVWLNRLVPCHSLGRLGFRDLIVIRQALRKVLEEMQKSTGSRALFTYHSGTER